MTTFLNTVELLLQRHPSFQQWQRVLGAQFETLNAVGRKGQKEQTTRYRYSSEAPSSFQSQQSPAPENIVRTMPPPEPHSTDQPMASTSTSTSASAVPAMLAKMQAQFSQFSKAQQAQQTQFSTQLEGISNRLNRIETLNNIPSPPPPTNLSSQQLAPDPLPQHTSIIPFTDTAAPSGTIPWKPADIGFFYPDMPRVAAGQGQGSRVRAGMSLEGRVRAQMSGPQVRAGLNLEARP